MALFEPHNIYSFEEDFLEDGEVAVCSCGWRSKRGAHRQAMAWHATHKQEQGDLEIERRRNATGIHGS
jgi:hypothetical protein